MGQEVESYRGRSRAAHLEASGCKIGTAAPPDASGRERGRGMSKIGYIVLGVLAILVGENE